ncbi:peroxidase [Pseudonocardia sp. WMMC193]|uniref:Dyp-type peroxidase n=1 Tax=Pseudonocardia sp. WMMC193 TaxID=2911965 RepID=UPI001F33249C|nr:peroxidase [Pseudonocardia sp. WMMC193]MCF7549911.1 peroxidase [Pseudonocardia sp. WMMC193]
MDLEKSLPTTLDPATEEALDTLQANILSGHVRERFLALFVHFGDAADGCAFLRALAPMIKPYAVQRWETAAFKAHLPIRPVWVGAALSASGYGALGRKADAPTDTAFRGGMKSSTAKLADPAQETWEAGYQGDVHAVVLIGGVSADDVEAAEDAVRAVLPPTVTVLQRETGRGQHNADGNGIEHFGYVDGRSQPLFVEAEIAAEDKTAWDPAFPLKQVLVPESANRFGSYFVFRKLEQNVRAFKTAEEHLADTLALSEPDRERAGALIVGRFEDGTPVVLSGQEAGDPHVVNDFGYDGDPDGLKCPHFAHIRKTNPRGTGGFEAVEGERSHIMARRGQTYGERYDGPNADIDPALRPTGGVGLLFMAYMSSVVDQFEFTQANWADFAGFPKAGEQPGLDPVIGQGHRPSLPPCPVPWGGPGLRPAEVFPQTVTLKGGEYFFAPSIAYLAAL